MNLFSLLDVGAKRYPRAGAVFHGNEMFCDWGRLRERALQLAHALRREAALGARVAIVSKNCPEYVEIVFATWAAGMAVVPINSKLHEREIAQILADADVSVIFASPSLAPRRSPSGDERVHLPRVFEIGGADYQAILAGPVGEPVVLAPEALAWLFFTSGTTGRPKGAMLSQRNLMAMATAHLADFENVEHTHSIIHSAPMSHGSGLCMVPYVARAARQVVPMSGGFDAAEFLELCERHGGAGAFLAPTMLRRVRLEAERSNCARIGLRSIIYGGGPMYVDELKNSLRTFGPIFCQLYGQGESPMTITGLRQIDHQVGDDAVLGSVGWPRSGVEVAVVDAQGRALPAGEIGEIVCRGDVVMSGYWRNPTATAAALRDGWLLTGDMGRLDDDGKLVLLDRSKDVIISGGSNIYPREVEDALLSCRGVAEVSVVGTPDPEWGEIVVAFVVRTMGGEEPHEATLDAHCLARIARFKRPKRYIFRDALPKNSNGKVLKRELSQLLCGAEPRALNETHRTGNGPSFRGKGSE